jgi:hypothetical protein
MDRAQVVCLQQVTLGVSSLLYVENAVKYLIFYKKKTMSCEKREK